MKVFNKVESDFPTLLEYNNYLEEVEDIIYSIVNEEPNAEECKIKIKQYEEINRAQIVIRQSQRADEERSIQDRIAAEQRDYETRKRDYQEEEKLIALTKRKLKQESTEVLLGVRRVVHITCFLICIVFCFTRYVCFVCVCEATPTLLLTFIILL